MRGIVELADGVHQVSVQPGVNIVVVRDDAGITLIDCGLDLPGLCRRLRRLGITPEQVTRVLLTHAHADHLGGIRRLWAAGSRATLAIGAIDAPVARGESSHPSAERRSARVVTAVSARLPAGRMPVLPHVEALAAETTLDIAGGVTVVATPGHTPGHVAFHLTERDVLVAGDTVFNVFGLRPAPGLLCWQQAPNRASVARLAATGAGTLALAHGRPVTDDVPGRLHSLLGGSDR